MKYDHYGSNTLNSTINTHGNMGPLFLFNEGTITVYFHFLFHCLRFHEGSPSDRGWDFPEILTSPRTSYQSKFTSPHVCNIETWQNILAKFWPWQYHNTFLKYRTWQQAQQSSPLKDNMKFFLFIFFSTLNLSIYAFKFHTYTYIVVI
jgi:hypothetical protein